MTKLSVVLKPPFTKWVGVHHYACSWQLQPEQEIKHRRVVLESVALGATSLRSLCAKLLPEFGHKQIVRRKNGSVWFCGCCCWLNQWQKHWFKERGLSATREKDCTSCHWHAQCPWCVPALERLSRAGPSFSSLTILLLLSG